MKKKKKYILAVIIIFIVISIIFVGYMFFFKKGNTEIIQEVKVTNSIDEYGYTLDDRDTDIFKEKFEQLKKLLNEEEIDTNEYVKLISELFIIDFYTIDNKISKYDVGGLEFVYTDARESFKTVAMDTIYKNVLNNLSKDRTQLLPVVKSINVQEISEDNYTMPDETKVDAYLVNVSWDYDKDYGYDDEVTLVLIKNDKKYEIVSLEVNS